MNQPKTNNIEVRNKHQEEVIGLSRIIEEKNMQIR